MTRWVALLRGVNVNGITIRSAELAALFRERGYQDVRTVLASGNVVFGSDGTAAALKTDIEQSLRDRFGYDAWIVLVPHDDLAAVVDGFPFPAAEDHHDYVVFGSDEDALDDLLADLEVDESVERVARGAGVVYWSCPKGSSTDTVFAKRAGAARFKRTTTTRNANTLRKLL
ncbi:DUF1697 domain-containing protein [Curtobacterium sp. MCBA15_013]|uniref:DUF1697 domain-containing protein n=1 Tax=Curtobacterium sp. MCBA15_013 TaxID=1898739 RepID=UPI0008DD1C9C|nr:DUF1697 domain-containing protein [Curtobacterium sp. MCBA15_013]OII24644.1 pyridoxamine 5-phosphate oxidase [Curtobacterium sp. MCBA15_013]